MCHSKQRMPDHKVARPSRLMICPQLQVFAFIMQDPQTSARLSNNVMLVVQRPNNTSHVSRIEFDPMKKPQADANAHCSAHAS